MNLVPPVRFLSLPHDCANLLAREMRRRQVLLLDCELLDLNWRYYRLGEWLGIFLLYKSFDIFAVHLTSISWVRLAIGGISTSSAVG